MQTLFLITLINFKTTPPFYMETSADLSTEFAEIYDVKFPAVLRFFSLIFWDYIGYLLPNFSTFSKIERLERAGVFIPKLNLAHPNFPISEDRAS